MATKTKKATKKKKTTTTATKRKALELTERIEVLKLLDNGRSVRSIAEEFGVGKTQISDVNMKRKEIEESWENGVNGTKKQ